MEPNSIVLEGVQTIAKAEALHQEIEEQLNNSNRLSIDASDVERADTAVMQVLTSLVNDREVEVEIKASDALKECAHLLGLKTLEAKFQ